MNVEDKLISIIKEKLIERNRVTKTIDYQHNCQIALAPESTLFFECYQIELKKVSIRLIQDLYQMKESSWVDWILTGLSYQILFNIELNESILPFVPWKMLTQWPLTFFLSQQPVFGFCDTTLTRETIVKLPENCYLVKLKNQKLTEEAKELILKNKIVVIERLNESCIWAE
ncbi:PduM family microcompartment protein [Vagococcus sp.]|uniref:PduM family microcompartment protein n=1 Tax=Vagococcus sp. TaxID=1933889 RepID=UPI002FC5D20B